MWQLATLIAFCPQEAVNAGKDNNHIHKVPRRCDITRGSLISHFPNQVWKRQLKFGEFEKKQLLLFQATTHQKEGILAAEALAINKTANAYALSQTDEHEIPALLTNIPALHPVLLTAQRITTMWSTDFFCLFLIFKQPVRSKVKILPS